MAFPTLTAFYAGLLGLIYLGIVGWVTTGRRRLRVNLGDGGHSALQCSIRAHANFAEYVPLALLLIGLLEAGGGNPGVVRALLVVLVVARMVHPIGMVAPVNSVQQLGCRGGGSVATWLVVGVASVMLVVRGL